ncbi:rhodanese-like domain-containing protein [Enterococcus sp. CSURQ0835]|uniref:rhodanese-like domain-containing protein n=1 Tax=Enterococcus sp. CSURQ0835 TaxID=2681394 RepID=UPI001357D3EF|nr:rhodanese-like domain-containing protein [Enterococcus sp. CSURQ0835]
MFETLTSKNFLTKWQQGSLHVLDVRRPAEYKEGHIPQAQNLPLEDLPQLFTQLAKEEHYYLICRSGRRSEQAAQFLSERGYHVTNVAGGMNAWTGKQTS